MEIESDKVATSAAELRRQAEEQWKAKKPMSAPLTLEEAEKLVHELELHQIELELQNAELQLAREQMERALEGCAGLNSSLEERISQAVDELRCKDQQLLLKSRQAVMGEMIHNIAHQWRQPLNSLAIIIQEVQLRYLTEQFSNEFFLGSVGKSMKLINYMSQTVDDFRDFFRIDKEPIVFGVNLIIARTLSLVEESFKEHNIEITVHSEDDPTIEGYPSEYSQVLLNILLNARDALVAKGEGDLPIAIRAFSEGGKSVVTITDQGGGIDRKVLNKLFHPYVTTKEPEQGTGIGLFMAKNIIEQSMGGRLTARNTAGGAEFRIEI